MQGPMLSVAGMASSPLGKLSKTVDKRSFSSRCCLGILCPSSCLPIHDAKGLRASLATGRATLLFRGFVATLAGTS